MAEKSIIYGKSGTESKCKTIVTLFGNTEMVAEALSRGVQKHGVEVNCISIKDVGIDKLGQYNLIAVGAPYSSNRLKSEDT